MTPHTTSQTIRKTLDILFQPGDVVELRIPEAGRYKTLSGYFDDMDKLAESAAKASGQFSGIYVTLNPCVPELLARSANRTQPYAKVTTADSQTMWRRWLLGDVDWQRPKGISTTDEEHDAAIQKAYQIRDELMLEGWPLPIVADSGNGAHLLYRVDLPPDDSKRIEATLKAWNERFGDEHLMVDTAVFNPSRIVKLYGTMVCKGDNISSRPHRLAAILEVPDDIQVVPEELLAIPEPQKPTSGRISRNGFSGETWMTTYVPEARGPEPYAGGKKWVLPECPWRPDDGDAAYVIELPSGAMFAGCQHATCPGSKTTGNHWPEFRKQKEPKFTPKVKRSANDLPEIIITARPLRDITADAMNAIVGYNDPAEIFIRAGSLVRIGSDENDEPIIDTMTESAVRGRLARCSEFLRTTQNGEMMPIPPALDVVRDIMALGRWPFPPLLGIVETPFVTQSGHVVLEPGYNEETRLMYTPGRLLMDEISQEPTQQEIEDAIELLQEVICNFPFGDDASKANTIAAMITPIVRPAIRGPVPLVLFDKPQAGTGASLLSEVIALIATGRSNAMMTAPKSDEEWDKSITAMLKQGRSVVTIDNIEGLLFAAPLSVALTSNVWTGRILGQSQMITLPQRATWIATGNNVQLGGDLPRRCYWVRLDAKTARPWQRNGFMHPRLLEWAAGERSRILASILTLAKAWFAAGKPAPEGLPTMGSFEDWTRTIGGILELAGVTGFLGNIEQMYEQSDQETPQWEAFTQAWRNAFGNEERTCNEVIRYLESAESAKHYDKAQEIWTEEQLEKANALKDALPEAVLDRSGKINTRSLGRAMMKRKDMLFVNGLVIRKGKEIQRASCWKVLQRETEPKTAVQSELSELSEFSSILSLGAIQQKGSQAGLENKHITHITHIDNEPEDDDYVDAWEDLRGPETPF